MTKEEEREYYKQYRKDHADKIKQRKRQYRIDHIDEIKRRDKQYYEDNADRIKQQTKQYRKTHKEKTRERHNSRRQKDPTYKLTCSLRTRLCMALKQNNKAGSAVKDLGCSIPDFKQYIEKKFQSGMTWNNYGRQGWHFDHIISLSKFNLQDRTQLLIALNYTNYQPLWWRDNIVKWNLSVEDFREGIF